MAATTADETIREVARQARAASRRTALLSTEAKNRALAAIADGLERDIPALIDANATDVARARERGAKPALVDRLALDRSRISAIARGVREIMSLADPVGRVLADERRPNGLRVRRSAVPLGVIAMIYEARPNVTVEASALALKAGNAVILRGGSEAEQSNAALAAVIGDALVACNVPRDAVQILASTDRDAIRSLVQQSGFIDLAIPRGGEALIRFVTEHARVPVVQHYKGVCHMFVDSGVEPEAAAAVVGNAKLSRPGVCNALECLLVDAADAARVLPVVAHALIAGGCRLRGCERTCALVPEATAARDDDWGTEFLDTVLAVRVVDGMTEALAHIAQYGSGHTEAILTPRAEHAERFRREVDAACVVVNASTRFHDGGELGLGAEIGIATSRLHWRGPMGLESLTTLKWMVDGDGQIRP